MLEIAVNGSMHKLLRFVRNYPGLVGHTMLKHGKQNGQQTFTYSYEEGILKGGPFHRNVNLLVENGLMKRYRMRRSCKDCNRRLPCLSTNRCTKEFKIYMLTKLGWILSYFLDSKGSPDDDLYYKDVLGRHKNRRGLSWEFKRKRFYLILSKPGKIHDFVCSVEKGVK